MEREESEHAQQQKVHEHGRIMQRRVMLHVVRVGVWIESDETLISARMTLAAGLDQVAGSHHRVLIRGGQDFVVAVAVPAARSLLIAEGRHLSMKGFAVSGELV